MHAQYADPLPSLAPLSQIENPLQHIFLLLQRITPILQKSQHAAPEAVSISIPHKTIIGFLDESANFDEFYHKVKIAFITSLIHEHFTAFHTQPYRDGDYAIAEQS